MQKLLIVVLVLSCIFIPSTSYAQTQSNMIVFVQIKVRDSSSNLVSYIESTNVILEDVPTLNQLLDQNAPVMTKSLMASGNNKFELIKLNNTVTQESPTVVSKNMISVTNGKKLETLVIADHDGYPVVKGDVVTAYWTIIRPVS